MRRLPLRRLVGGPAPARDRIFYSNIWFSDHVNRRSEELLARLDRVDAYLFTCSDRRLLRAAQFRALYHSRPLREPPLLYLAGRRYRAMLTTDNEQIAHFPGRIVADVDDPRFTEREVDLLGRPNVAAFVVTAERAGRRFEELGVRTPWHVVPQGVDRSTLSEAETRAVAERLRRPGDFVVGYLAAWLRTGDDRDGDNPLYNVDHLLELWPQIRARTPNARLWLVGAASRRVRLRAAALDDVLVLGRLPRHRFLATVACFDVALYPRTRDQGIEAAKLTDYLGAGVPTVAYDYEVTALLRDTGAGVLVQTPRELVDAVAALARDDARRAGLAAAARAAGAERDWDRLARHYATEVLDRYLPPS